MVVSGIYFISQTIEISENVNGMSKVTQLMIVAQEGALEENLFDTTSGNVSQQTLCWTFDNMSCVL